MRGELERAENARKLIAEAAVAAGVSPDLVNLWKSRDFAEVERTMTRECVPLYMTLDVIAELEQRRAS